jgi:hypothetical protein
MFWNLTFMFVPMVFSAVKMTTLMRPAMRPYSMAVAPDSFFTKDLMVLITGRSLRFFDTRTVAGCCLSEC